MQDAELVGLAQGAARNAIVPFSQFHVGAAVLCCDGSVFLGCNIENISLSMSVCAEQVALLNALSSGQREFARIAVWGDSDTYTAPCGKCRQLLFEFAPGIEVIMADRGGQYLKRPIAELLPMPFKHRTD